MKKVIAISSDHAGYKLKEEVKEYLHKLNFEVVDLGSNTDSVPSSYAEYGKILANYIKLHKLDFSIGICGTGLGIGYALNRFKGIRAARVTTPQDAQLAKLHNNANVLTFGGRQLTKEQAFAMIDEYLKTEFEGGRHQQRIDELDK